LKKHEEDHDARISRIREEIVVEQQAIASLHADLDKRQQRLAQLENELLEAVRAKERDLQKEREAFELTTQRITMAVSPNKIDLNVGGRVFSVTTRKQTPKKRVRALQHHLQCVGRTRLERMVRTLSTAASHTFITLSTSCAMDVLTLSFERRISIN
jgi:chromosome segregation ATPase